MKSNKEYFKTLYDNGGIYRQNKYGKLRLAGKPKILLKQLYKSRKKEYNENDAMALDNAKQIYEFVLRALEEVSKTGLSPFVFYPNNNLYHKRNINENRKSNKNNGGDK